MKYPFRALGVVLLVAAAILFGYLVYDATALAEWLKLRPDREAVVAIFALLTVAGLAAAGAWLLMSRR